MPEHTPIELLTWRSRVSGARAAIKQQTLAEAGLDPAPSFKGERQAYFAEAGGFVDTPTYDRYRLGGGMTIAGPAIIEERESTIVLRPGMKAFVDRYANVRLRLR